MNNSFVFRRISSFYEKRYPILSISLSSSTSSPSSSTDIHLTMKKLLDDKQYKQVLDLFDKQSKSCTDVMTHMAIKACIYLNEYQRIIDIERKLSRKSLNNSYIQTALVQFYMQRYDIKNAYRLFSEIPDKSNYMYTTMFKGLISNKLPAKVFDLVAPMKIEPNQATLTVLFTACARVADDHAKQIGKEFLDKMPKSFLNDTILLNSAMHMLMKFGDVIGAEHFFQMIKKKDIISYGALMKGYVENHVSDKALDLFEQIPFNLNNITYAIIFNACAQLSNDRAKEIGRKLLRQMPKNLYNNNVLITSAVDMLMKFGDVTSAEHWFKMIKTKDIVTYSTMMNGYNISNEPLKSLQLFKVMKRHHIAIDEFMSTILIGSCARLGMLRECQSIVDEIPSHFYENPRVCNSLIDMWGKAGSVENALKIFRRIDQPDSITYNAMINTYGRNRMGLEAVDLYRKMPDNLRNEVTHVCVLNACSHSALHDEAYSIFNEICDKTQRIITTMIDCSSRLFLFDQAQRMIDDYEKSNPPSSTMYMAMLSGARNSRQEILSKQIYDRMKKLFPNEKEILISGSILLSNIYSSLGDYEEAESIRSTRIKEFGKNVKPGVSWTEVNGEIVEFKANDHSHPRSKEIHAQAKHISDILIKYGHNYDSSWITRSLAADETVESVLCSHSERLAIAYHLIQQEKPSFIQITKNLRVCGDCHQATKLIAKIWQCQIIVRDANCIHHFSPNGTCSCQDHF